MAWVPHTRTQTLPILEASAPNRSFLPLWKLELPNMVFSFWARPFCFHDRTVRSRSFSNAHALSCSPCSSTQWLKESGPPLWRALHASTSETKSCLRGGWWWGVGTYWLVTLRKVERLGSFGTLGRPGYLRAHLLSADRRRVWEASFLITYNINML